MVFTLKLITGNADLTRVKLNINSQLCSIVLNVSQSKNSWMKEERNEWSNERRKEGKIEERKKGEEYNMGWTFEWKKKLSNERRKEGMKEERKKWEEYKMEGRKEGQGIGKEGCKEVQMEGC